MQKIRSRIPVSTHIPETSAATAVPIYRGTAILLIARPCSPVDPLDHKTTSTFAFVFEAAVPKACRLPRLRIVLWVKDYVPLSLCANVGAMVSFLIVFCKRVSRSRQSSKSVWLSSLSTRGTGSFELGQFVLCTSVPENIDH